MAITTPFRDTRRELHDFEMKAFVRKTRGEKMKQTWVWVVVVKDEDERRREEEEKV